MRAAFIVWVMVLANIARADTNTVAANALVFTNDFPTPTNFAQLLALPPDQLDKVDIARIDLLCAEGLPGAENLDMEKSLKTLDAWAKEVKDETDRNYHRFVEHPEKFKNSLGHYRMAVMSAVLSQDLRMQYNPQRAKELDENRYFNDAQPYGEAERTFTSDSSDFYLHGLLSEKRYGTCASMPYLYVAIGRRLGYPVSIAAAYMHNYVYYDESGGKHFNVEATETRGLFTPSDDDYRRPPVGAAPGQGYYEARGFLQPMSNKFSMGHLLATRASIFRSHGQHDEEEKTWKTAERYFPDTPAWKEIENGMEKAANFDDYQQWRQGVWKELSARAIPEGPGFAYFLDLKIKLYLFMNESIDRKAVETAVDEYKRELNEYSITAVKLFDDRTASDQVPQAQQVPQTQTLILRYRPPGGNEVDVPADFLPPFPGGMPPPDLHEAIANAKPQDTDTLLEMMWNYYGQMQVVKQEKEKAEEARIASGNPVLISEESIPPEFRRSVPPELAMRLAGMHDAKDMVVEMWVYKQEMEARQKEEAEMMGANPMAGVSAALRQAGLIESVARNSGLPVSDLPGQPAGGFGVPVMPGTDPFGGIPLLQARAGQATIPSQNMPALGQPLGFDDRVKQGNQQAMKLAEQYMRSKQDTLKPGFQLPYQVVPAAAAGGNPAVENPLPFGKLPNSSLTTVPQ